MTPEQYDQFLGDLRALRVALDLPTGALGMSPRAALLECVEAARNLNPYRNGWYGRGGKEAWDRA